MILLEMMQKVNVASRFNSLGHSFWGLVDLPSAPSEPPFNVKADSPDSTEVHVQWNHIPKNKLNGELKGYELSYKAQDGQPERVRLEDPTRHVSDDSIFKFFFGLLFN